MANPFIKVWFWLLIVAIIGFIVAFVLYEQFGIGYNDQGNAVWIWIVLILSFVLWIIAIIIYAVDVSKYNREREIAIACGLIVPEVKKPIKCPDEDCVKREIQKCEETAKLVKESQVKTVVPVATSPAVPVGTAVPITSGPIPGLIIPESTRPAVVPVSPVVPVANAYVNPYANVAPTSPARALSSLSPPVNYF